MKLSKILYYISGASLAVTGIGAVAGLSILFVFAPQMIVGGTITCAVTGCMGGYFDWSEKDGK